MDPPPVQYATTNDGLSIAYGVSGEGRALVFLPWVFEHIQLAWQYPGLSSWLEGLSKRFKLVQIDLPVFRDDEALYLLYTVAGESGIAIARIYQN